MSFVGDLEHLPIVDVIQLLHSTRKSGTLCLRNPKGESQLVFSDGFIVSANHLNNSVRIGQILVEMNAISREELDKTLNEQKGAGTARLPLIAALVESGRIKKEDAFRGLETLIEMTIVEVLTWTSGTFSLDVDQIIVSDEYRYFPEKLHQDFHLNTQNVLMDSLRIFDEKMRDGTLNEESFYREEPARASVAPVEESPAFELTADDLGLGELETLTKKIPDVFTGIRLNDPMENHRKALRAELAGITPEEQERLFAWLVQLSAPPEVTSTPREESIILFSRDAYLTHTLLTLCRHEGFCVFCTDEEENLDLFIDQSLQKNLIPVLVVDSPDRDGGKRGEETTLTLLQRKLDKYSWIHVLQLVSPRDYEFSLRALKLGVRSVLPRPFKGEREAFVADTISFLESFSAHLKKSFPGPDRQVLHKFSDFMSELITLEKSPDVSYALLKFASLMFNRSITFIVSKAELIAERGIGLADGKSDGAAAPLRVRIPLGQPSVFQDVIDSGRSFFGPCDDAALKSHLYSQIAPPLSTKIILVPIKIMGKVAAMTYGDFGASPEVPVHPGLLDFLASHTGQALDNALLRKRLENQPRS